MPSFSPFQGGRSSQGWYIHWGPDPILRSGDHISARLTNVMVMEHGGRGTSKPLQEVVGVMGTQQWV